MNRCIDTMMEEHELIIQVLAALQTMAEKLEAGEQVPRRDVAGFGTFFRQFADKCHHGKEEDQLFAKMVESGFPRESGPIGVMFCEHDEGRAEVRSLVEIGNGSGPLTEVEEARVIGCATRFVPLLYGHIQKENNILYPMAQQAITPQEMAALDESCAAFDRKALGQGEVLKLKQLAAELMGHYPACAEALAVHGGCAGCASGH